LFYIPLLILVQASRNLPYVPSGRIPLSRVDYIDLNVELVSPLLLFLRGFRQWYRVSATLLVEMWMKIFRILNSAAHLKWVFTKFIRENYNNHYQYKSLNMCI
jgi:hypothetical protein